MAKPAGESHGVYGNEYGKARSKVGKVSENDLSTAQSLPILNFPSTPTKLSNPTPGLPRVGEFASSNFGSRTIVTNFSGSQGAKPNCFNRLRAIVTLAVNRFEHFGIYNLVSAL
jgi:hypothetical protein